MGQGSYGMVVKAKHRLTKRKVAIKHMLVETEHQYSLVKVLREIKITQFCNNAETRKEGMEKYFAGLLDLFCPPDEMK